MIKKYVFVIALCISLINAFAQDVTITVNANQNKRAVSPYIYGRNNTFDQPAQFYKDAGLRFARMNGGNNATKYNWRKKISSHPDWYNNVYANNWDKTSLDIAKDHPEMQAMWAFQLLGRVASSTEYNFNDWGYNNSNWWQGVGQNLAGGGVPNEANPNGKALVEGDIDLYTEKWPADSTVGILNHWFGSSGIGLDKKQFLYWSMDNEADVWNGTHDDVMSDGLLPASEFMANYIEIAKKARTLFPEIKICGPVTTSEWQWFKWGEESLKIDGKYYCWLEYFIKRCADEEKASGIRVLDVFDIHHYPYAPANSDALQNHRAFYDKTYVYPGANGIKTINGGWDNAQNKEYIFLRINEWLDKHYGENHGITLGLSEWSPGPDEPNLASVIYATHLGTFANNGVEYFTPWNWFTGMWESLHLFSRYARDYSVSSISSLEKTVSAYTTVNETADSITVIVVNRDMKAEQNVTVNLNDFAIEDGLYRALQLSSLPANETFKSHDKNALKEKAANVQSNSFTITVPALSTTAVLIPSVATITGENDFNRLNNTMIIYPNPVANQLSIRLNSEIDENCQVHIFDRVGMRIKSLQIKCDGNNMLIVDVSSLSEGFYFISANNNQCIETKSFIVAR
ncbi:MAG TPA: glycoside hydrolase family 44 protein [Prolixibacteraceae bacterium]|nr:glycoside hydrolase family 44 protein [Prolixibacteraceae bacterium]